MRPYISRFEEKKKKKTSKDSTPKLKIGDKVIQNTSGIEGTVLEKPEKEKKYIPIKWDGGSQTSQHVDSITKKEEEK